MAYTFNWIKKDETDTFIKGALRRDIIHLAVCEDPDVYLRLFVPPPIRSGRDCNTYVLYWKGKVFAFREAMYLSDIETEYLENRKIIFRFNDIAVFYNVFDANTAQSRLITQAKKFDSLEEQSAVLEAFLEAMNAHPRAERAEFTKGALARIEAGEYLK